MSEINDFINNGYVIINDCFSNKQIDNLRNLIKKISGNSKKTYLLTSECMKEKEIYETIFNDKLVKKYREIIGEEVYLVPELHVQINQFPKSKLAGWHYDGQSERNNNYLKKKNRKFFRVGIYLQENNKEFGGGIDILNNKLFKILPLKINQRIESKIIHLISLFQKKTIISKKGSVVFFDSRLPHKGTFPKNKNIFNNINKYTIYFQIGNKEHCKYFIDNSVKRMFNNFDNPNVSNYFLDYLKINYPEEYPIDFLNLLKKNKINIMTAGKTETVFFKQFKDYIENLK